VIEVFPTEKSVEKVVYLVAMDMNERYEKKRLKNFESVIEELRELRRERYVNKEIKIILNKERIYTQNS